ncbi:hypothetical protein GCM10009628_37820 [Paeniglutamicibacter kerguelensis]
MWSRLVNDWDCGLWNVTTLVSSGNIALTRPSRIAAGMPSYDVFPEENSRAEAQQFGDGESVPCPFDGFVSKNCCRFWVVDQQPTGLASAREICGDNHPDFFVFNGAK